MEMPEEQKQKFSVRGVSVHSVEDARLAEQCGATYLTAGHVFVTDCKKGLAPRGLDFLHEVCSSVKIPVYAIGGIHEEKYGKLHPVRCSRRVHDVGIYENLIFGIHFLLLKKCKIFDEKNHCKVLYWQKHEDKCQET